VNHRAGLDDGGEALVQVRLLWWLLLLAYWLGLVFLLGGCCGRSRWIAGGGGRSGRPLHFIIHLSTAGGIRILVGYLDVLGIGIFVGEL